MEEVQLKLRAAELRPPPGTFPSGGLIDTLARSCTGLIALLSPDAELCYVSPSYEAMLGYPPASLSGRQSETLLHPDDLGLACEAWRELLAVGSASLLSRVRHADGGWRWVECMLRTVDHGGARLVLLTGFDLTARQQQEAMLLHSQRAMLLGMLAGGYVHDINNLLTVIEGGALLAAEELSVEHVAQEHLSAVRQSAITAGAMSRRLLGFVRRQPMVAEPLDLCSFCRDGVPLFGRLLGSRIWLQVECQPELWQVRADRLQVEQLLMNLLVNARDAMPEGGMVQVVAHNLLAGEPEGLLPGDYVCIEVRDTGVGIDPAIRERLFEPFATSKGPGKGVGLGLATCNHIVSELGGAIGVESEPGVGTSFRVYLPRYVAD